MNPNAANLVMRDNARAARLGANPGADFGNWSPSFAGGPAPQFGDETPTPENMRKALEEKIASRRRMSIMNPNMGSDVSVQRYMFALNSAQVIGVAAAINALGNPQTYFRPQRLTTNVPTQAFATATSLQVANVGILVGGVVDLSDLNNVAVGQELDVPTLSPANAANLIGNYLGFAPPPFAGGQAFNLTLSFKGPATLTP